MFRLETANSFLSINFESVYLTDCACKIIKIHLCKSSGICIAVSDMKVVPIIVHNFPFASELLLRVFLVQTCLSSWTWCTWRHHLKWGCNYVFRYHASKTRKNLHTASYSVIPVSFMRKLIVHHSVKSNQIALTSRWRNRGVIIFQETTAISISISGLWDETRWYGDNGDERWQKFHFLKKN